jgi:hypothetical protein
VAMLAEIVDAVIGVDTHRDFHQVEIAYPSGAMIATRSFSNDSVGYAETLAWVFPTWLTDGGLAGSRVVDLRVRGRGW